MILDPFCNEEILRKCYQQLTNATISKYHLNISIQIQTSLRHRQSFYLWPLGFTRAHHLCNGATLMMHPLKRSTEFSS